MHVRIHIQKRGRTVSCIVPGLSYKRKQWHRVAFTLIELLIVLAIIATLMGVGMPLYQNQLERARIMVAVSDIESMKERIKDFLFEERRMPDNLTEVPGAKRQDPWGSPYEYLRIEGNRDVAKFIWRKDQWEIPVNTDYDLFSLGKDGVTAQKFRDEESWDDIIRCNDGTYVGLVSDY
ncbi:MAG: prepilin-type N-terminal cleavage/methylation domain-containing protein [Candidatus Aminicenantaceae bacterium]